MNKAFQPVSVFHYEYKLEDGETRSIHHYVSRSRTGIYHISHSNNPRANNCNSRNGGFGASFAQPEHVAQASPAMFCKKCFGEKGIQKAKEAAAALLG